MGNGTPGTVGPSSSSTATASFPSGPVSISLNVKNSFNCARTITKLNFIQVHPPVSADFTANKTTFCEPVTGSATSTFAAISSTSYTYAWNFGHTGGTGTGTPVNNTFPGSAPQSFTVKMTATDPSTGCSKEVTKTNYINISKVTAGLTGPNEVCVGHQTSAFTSTSTVTGGGSHTADWSVDGVQLGAGNSFNFTWPTSGTVKVKVTATSALGCIDTASKTVIVRPQPVVDFISAPTDPCPAPQTITFTPVPNNCTSYAWDFGGGTPGTGTSTGSSPSISSTYPDNLDYTVTMVATSPFGCKDTITKINKVRLYDGVLAIDQDKIGDCLPAKIIFSPTWFSRGLPGYIYAPGSTYTWDFGESSTSKLTTTSTNATWTYTTLGTFTVTLKAVTPNGCIFYATSIVRTGPKPTANFTAVGAKGDRDVCSGEKVYFTNLSTNATSYSWRFGDGNGVNVHTPVYAYDSVDAFTVTLIANNNECRDTMIKVNYITVRPPWAKFEPKYHCDDRKKVTFENKTVRGTSYLWQFGYPSIQGTSATKNPTFTFASLGNPNVRLIAINDTFQCSDTLDFLLDLIDPTPILSPLRSRVCVDDTTLLVSGGIGGTYGGWKWYVDDAYIYQQIPTPTLVHKFDARGYHKVKVTLLDGHKCPDSITVDQIVLASRPEVGFSASPLLACVPINVTFTDTSKPTITTSIFSRTWEFGDGTGSFTTTSNTIGHLYTSRGSYPVKLIATDNLGCKDSLTRTPYIEGLKPIANYSVSRSVGCQGEGLIFAVTGQNAKKAEWDFGDGKTDTGLLRTHQYWSSGKFTIRLIVTDSIGCRDTLIKTNAIEITRPKAGPISITPDSVSTCPPLIATMTATGMVNAATYRWFTPINPGPQVKMPYTEVFQTPGYYKVLLVVQDVNNCFDTTVAHVDVLGYAGSFTYGPISGCAPLDVNFSSLVKNIVSITWDFADGSVQVGNGPTTTHTYFAPGSYLPKMMMIDGTGCAAVSPGLDTIRVDGVYADFETSPTCEGYYVKFQDKSRGEFSAIQHREWVFEDGSRSTLPLTVRQYPKTGKYPIRIIATNKNGCIDSMDREITVHPLPEISAGSDTVICLKDAAQLMGTGGTSYVWSPAGYLSCTNCASPLASPPNKTVYTVIGTDDNNCSDTDDVEVNIKTKVVALAAEGGDLCVDEKMALSVKGGRDYLWTPSDGLDNDKSSNPVASPRNNIKYRVVSFEASCIPDTDYVDIKVHPKPTVTATGEKTLIAGNSTTLIAQGERIQRFKWTPADVLSCSDCADPIATPAKTTIFNVSVFTDKNCQDSDKVTITVLCDESQVFIPNTFTPNGDGQNDVFYPRGNGIDQVKSFRIYNRWGELVYERKEFKMNDASSGWNGTFKGQQLPPDVFVYSVEAYCASGEVFSWKGDVSLLR